MEITINPCSICGKHNSLKETSFCSDACFDIWWAQMEAELLLIWIEMELKKADAKPC